MNYKSDNCILLESNFTETIETRSYNCATNTAYQREHDNLLLDFVHTVMPTHEPVIAIENQVRHF